jgi:hypothetical protein
MCPKNLQFLFRLLLRQRQSLVSHHPSAILMAYEDVSYECAISLPAAAKADTVSCQSAFAENDICPEDICPEDVCLERHQMDICP